eukprot:COSAG01_NODE_23_length_37704_cov_30.005877_22_plen_292_part_00
MSRKRRGNSAGASVLIMKYINIRAGRRQRGRGLAAGLAAAADALRRRRGGEILLSGWAWLAEIPLPFCRHMHHAEILLSVSAWLAEIPLPFCRHMHHAEILLSVSAWLAEIPLPFCRHMNHAEILLSVSAWLAEIPLPFRRHMHHAEILLSVSAWLAEIPLPFRRIEGRLGSRGGAGDRRRRRPTPALATSPPRTFTIRTARRPRVSSSQRRARRRRRRVTTTVSGYDPKRWLRFPYVSTYLVLGPHINERADWAGAQRRLVTVAPCDASRGVRQRAVIKCAQLDRAPRRR